MSAAYFELDCSHFHLKLHVQLGISHDFEF